MRLGCLMRLFRCLPRVAHEFPQAQEFRRSLSSVFINKASYPFPPPPSKLISLSSPCREETSVVLQKVWTTTFYALLSAKMGSLRLRCSKGGGSYCVSCKRLSSDESFLIDTEELGWGKLALLKEGADVSMDIGGLTETTAASESGMWPELLI